MSFSMIEDRAAWERLQQWLQRERTMTLARGQSFRARFDRVEEQLVFVPSETGIERRVKWDEWERFAARFNEVEHAGYNALQPGHYPRITFNSSYLVAIVREADLASRRERRGS